MATPNLDIPDRITNPAEELVFHALGVPFARAAATSSTGFALVRDDARIIWANASFAALTLLKRSPVGTQLDLELESQFRLAKDELSNALSAKEASTIELHHGRDSAPVQLHIAALDGDHRVLVAASMAPENADGYQALPAASSIDPLTRLGNERYLRDQLDAWQSESALTLLRLDIDAFSQVNESLGRMDADRLLQLVADRLTRSSRAGDTVFHTDGDEFIIWHATEDNGVKSGAAIAERMINVFDRPFRLDEHVIQISASVGIASVSSDQDIDPDEVLWQTEMAVRDAKRSGGQTWRVFTESNDG